MTLTNPAFRLRITAEFEEWTNHHNTQAKLNRAAGYPEVHREASEWFLSLNKELKDAVVKRFGNSPYNCYRGYSRAIQKDYYKVSEGKGL